MEGACTRATAEERRESYPAIAILAENSLYLTIWILAGWLLWPLRIAGWPVATLAWIPLVAVVQVLLKKHNCSGCYLIS